MYPTLFSYAKGAKRLRKICDYIARLILHFRYR